MYIDPITLNWLLIGAASFVAFMIGKNVGKTNDEIVIENTIEYLCSNGFIKHFINDKNEIEIVKLNGDLDNGSEEEK